MIDSLNTFVLVLLSQRIIMRYEMEPLEKEEVKSYIEHHLEAAGARHQIFSEEAVEALVALSHGWPKILNNLCINSLLMGPRQN